VNIVDRRLVPGCADARVLLEAPFPLLGAVRLPVGRGSFASQVIVGAVAEGEGEDVHLGLLFIDAVENAVFPHPKAVDPTVDGVLRADKHPAALAGRVPELAESLDNALPERPVSGLLEELPELFGHEELVRHAPSSAHARNPALQLLEREQASVPHIPERPGEAPEFLLAREDIDALKEGLVQLPGDRDHLLAGYAAHRLNMNGGLHKPSTEESPGAAIAGRTSKDGIRPEDVKKLLWRFA